MFREKFSSLVQAGSHLWNFLLASKWMLVKASEWIPLLPEDYISTCFRCRGGWKPGILLNSWSECKPPLCQVPVSDPCMFTLLPPFSMTVLMRPEHHALSLGAFSESGACTSSLMKNPSKEGWTWLDTSLICDQAMLLPCSGPLCLLNTDVAKDRQI